MKTYTAVLERDIQYFNGEKMIKVPKDTVILVDDNLNIALINGDYVALTRFEYTIVC